jgi:hypothetical protein
MTQEHPKGIRSLSMLLCFGKRDGKGSPERMSHNQVGYGDLRSEGSTSAVGGVTRKVAEPWEVLGWSSEVQVSDANFAVENQVQRSWEQGRGRGSFSLEFQALLAAAVDLY